MTVEKRIRKRVDGSYKTQRSYNPAWNGKGGMCRAPLPLACTTRSGCVPPVEMCVFSIKSTSCRETGCFARGSGSWRCPKRGPYEKSQHGLAAGSNESVLSLNGVSQMSVRRRPGCCLVIPLVRRKISSESFLLFMIWDFGKKVLHTLTERDCASLFSPCFQR